jgi:hypothetical protein
MNTGHEMYSHENIRDRLVDKAEEKLVDVDGLLQELSQNYLEFSQSFEVREERLAEIFLGASICAAELSEEQLSNLIAEDIYLLVGKALKKIDSALFRPKANDLPTSEQKL